MSKRVCNRKSLIRAVRVKGFSKRKAQKAINAVFELITNALSRKEPVETPFGTFAVRQYRGKERTISQPIRNVKTGERQNVATSRSGNRRVVRFFPNPAFWPRPKRDERAVIRRYSELLLGGGRGAPEELVEAILRVRKQAGKNANQLIARFRKVRKRGQVMSPQEILYSVANELGRGMTWQEAAVTARMWIPEVRPPTSPLAA